MRARVDTRSRPVHLRSPLSSSNRRGFHVQRSRCRQVGHRLQKRTPTPRVSRVTLARSHLPQRVLGATPIYRGSRRSAEPGAFGTALTSVEVPFSCHSQVRSERTSGPYRGMCRHAVRCPASGRAPGHAMAACGGLCSFLLFHGKPPLMRKGLHLGADGGVWPPSSAGAKTDVPATQCGGKQQRALGVGCGVGDVLARRPDCVPATACSARPAEDVSSRRQRGFTCN